MKKQLLAVVVMLMFLSSCEVELVDNQRHYHPHGWGQHSHHEGGHEHRDGGREHLEGR